jgi:long-chain acyl-CoA synthetase
VNPNQAAVEKWAQQNGQKGDYSEICANSKAKEHILEELTKTAKINKV